MAGLFYHDVLAALTAARGPFVIVGGLSVNLQGVPRFTSDLDVAVALDGSWLGRAAAIRMKTGTGRAQDDSDVEALRAYLALAPEQELRWLRDAWRFTADFLPAGRREAWARIRAGEA